MVRIRPKQVLKKGQPANGVQRQHFQSNLLEVAMGADNALTSAGPVVQGCPLARGTAGWHGVLHGTRVLLGGTGVPRAQGAPWSGQLEAGDGSSIVPPAEHPALGDPISWCHCRAVGAGCWWLRWHKATPAVVWAQTSSLLIPPWANPSDTRSLVFSELAGGGGRGLKGHNNP